MDRLIQVVFFGLWLIYSSAFISCSLSKSGLNKGTVRSQDDYVWVEQDMSYLEPENVTGPFQAWTIKNKFNYRYQTCGEKCTTPPPIGIRSAVPLGGISTGSVELRADGSFHEWTIMNLSPVGGAKIQVFEDAFLGIRTTSKPYNDPDNKSVEDSQAFVLRTHPPPKLPGVDTLTYTGLYPIAQLTVDDKRLPLSNVTVTAMSPYFVNDMNSSATPSVSFVFSASNPSTSKLVEASFMFNLPFGIEKLTSRSYPIKSGEGNGTARIMNKVAEDVDCFRLCNDSPDCLTWIYDSSNMSCSLLPSINLNGYNISRSSGLKGTWSTYQTPQMKCLTLDRKGRAPPSGNISLCSNVELNGISFGVFDDIVDMWNDFSPDGQFAFNGSNNYGVHGAIAGKLTIPPGQVVKFPITISWFYPNKDFGDKVFGNWYQRLFKSSEDVANNVLNGDDINLSEQMMGVSKLHEVFLGGQTPDTFSSVPVWLSDVLINSLSHIRSALWVSDGRWRQFEAFDCPNIDSVHNDGERHIPYIIMFPESVKSKMRGWAKSQLPNGMIPEQLQTMGCTCKSVRPIIDFPNKHGRVMSDVSSVFILYLLELYKWGNEKEFLTELYPSAKRAAMWHIASAEKYGTFYRIQNTYDILGLDQYDMAAYNSAFFLLAMKASTELALAKGDNDFADKCKQAFGVGQKVLDKYLWNDTMGYYNSYMSDITNTTQPNPGAVMTDTFYSQVLAHSAGLGDLVNRDRLRSHLNTELSRNDSPFGMIVQTGRYPYPGPSQDNAVWMMGNPNWASTQLRLGTDPSVALAVAKKTLDRWRTLNNDLWNVPGITGGIGYGIGGQPFMLSHYGYYMSSWHILLALSGQQTDLPTGRLAFQPKTRPPFNYPVLLPGVLGTISSSVGNESSSTITYSLKLMFGELQLRDLSINNNTYPGPVNITAGQTVQWE